MASTREAVRPARPSAGYSAVRGANANTIIAASKSTVAGTGAER
jgi:hypothetical protein